MKKYKYYSILRPIAPGTIPKEGIVEIVNFDEKEYVEQIKRDAWGYVIFDKEVSQPQDYDLMPEDFWSRHVYVKKLSKEEFSLSGELLKEELILGKKEALSFIKSHGYTYEFI